MSNEFIRISDYVDPEREYSLENKVSSVTQPISNTPYFTRSSYRILPNTFEKKQDNELYEFSNISECNKNIINLGDVFQDISIIHNVIVNNQDNNIVIEEITFPFVICINQECDLLTDFENHSKQIKKDSSFFHLIVLPAFRYEQFVIGKHWNSLRDDSNSRIRKKDMDNITVQDKPLEKNEEPRYHFLLAPSESDLPNLVVDFKHFFTVNRDYLYSCYSHKVYSLEPFVKERLSQRFCNYLCRIGIPNPADLERIQAPLESLNPDITV